MTRCSITSCSIAICAIASCSIASCPITSYPIASCPIPSRQVASRQVASCKSQVVKVCEVACGWWFGSLKMTIHFKKSNFWFFYSNSMVIRLIQLKIRVCAGKWMHFHLDNTKFVIVDKNVSAPPFLNRDLCDMEGENRAFRIHLAAKVRYWIERASGRAFYQW